MARPAKSVNVQTSHLTTEERRKRLETEKILKGKNDKIKPPSYLSLSQKRIFKSILNALKESDILGNIDVYILEQCAIAIDRITQIEAEINKDITLLTDTKISNTRKKYSDIFFRCCNELCLSPQARAKLSAAATEKITDKTDPLLNILGNGGENDD